MIRTALIHLILDTAINGFFDNVQKNFTKPICNIQIPNSLVSGCTCDVCFVDDKIINAPVGTKFKGSWMTLIFNGCDTASGMFYFITPNGEWIDSHIDNIVDILVYNDEGKYTIHNNAYTWNDDYGGHDSDNPPDDQ